MVAIIYHNMTYQKRLEKPFIIASGTYKGYYFWVVTYGTHPCAYIEIPNTHPFYNKFEHDDEHIDCHGGITYVHFGLADTIDSDKYLIGWDYNHASDFSYDLLPDIPVIDLGRDYGKKWTTQEIFDEIQNVIKQLKDLENKHE